MVPPESGRDAKAWDGHEADASAPIEAEPVVGQSARPRADAAVDHVEDLARAEALHQAGADRRALAGRADHRDRPQRVELVRQRVDVVVGREDRAGDVAGLPLVALAHVEDLQRRRRARAARAR